SPLARTHRPSITAIGRSAVEYGRVAARRMLEIIAGWSTSGASETAQTESRAIDPELLVRGSTDPGAEPASAPTGSRGQMRHRGRSRRHREMRPRAELARVVQVDPAQLNARASGGQS